MTFKHNKWDSEVMRSLEKVALQKGLIKADPIKKTAAEVIDTTPTSNLTENIFKLCNGLRAKGFDKEASEVECNFMNYKQAQTLYQAHKETGEDLIHAAHPKGSHKLENLDADEATIEDILDKHKRIVEVVNKKPTGKLASSKDILQAVKVALGADPLVERKDNTSRNYLSLKLGEDVGADLPPNPNPPKAGFGSGVGGTVALTAVGWAALKIIKSVGKYFGNLGKALKIVNIANEAELNASSEAKLVEAAKTLFTKIGPQATKEVIKDVGPEVIKAAGPSLEAATETVMASNAVGAGGIASWLSGVQSWVAGASATEVGAAGAEALVGGGSVVALGIGALAGYLIGTKIFGNISQFNDLIAAGDQVISEMNDQEDNLNAQDRSFRREFSNSLNQLKKLMPTQDKMNNPSKEDVMELINFNDLLGQAIQNAQSIWSIAIGHVDDQFLGRLRGFKNIQLHAINFIEDGNKLRELIIGALQDFRKKAEELLKKKSDASGGSDQLLSGYQSAKQLISKYESIIQAKRLPNANQLTTWLNGMKSFIAEESSDFAKIPSANKPDVAKEYLTRLNQAQQKLDAFRKMIS